MEEGFWQIAVIGLGIPLVLMAFLTWILHYFVALKTRPSSRTAWTVGIAFLIVAALFMWGTPAGYELWSVPLIIPAALIAFWFWKTEFRRAWIEDADQLPDGVTLADDDWVSGLLRLALVIVVGLGIALIRWVMKGAAGAV